MQNVTPNLDPGAGPASPATPAKPRAASETLADVLGRHTAVGSLWRAEGERIRCVACGHRCLIGAGAPRHLPGALQPGRPVARPVRLRRGRAVRSGREEAVLPCVSRERRADVRDDGVRFSLFLLPELGHQPGPARRRRPGAHPNRHAAATGEHRPAIAARGWWCRATTSRSSPPNGPWPSSSKPRKPGWPAPSSRTATPRPRRWISCARGLSPTRLT